jgi:hypothetical protein
LRSFPETVGQFLAAFQRARRSFLTFAVRQPVIAKATDMMHKNPASA